MKWRSRLHGSGQIFARTKTCTVPLAFTRDRRNWTNFWTAKALTTLIRFQTKTKLFCSVFKKIWVHTCRFRIVFTCPHYNAKRLYTLSAHAQMNSTHAHFNISSAKLARNWSHMIEWSGAWSWWRHRFQIASFSPSTLENSVFKKHRFQIAPLWRAFSNDSVFGDRFRRCSVDDIRIRSKTAPFSFENGLLWTGPKCASLGPEKKKVPNLHT